MEFSRTIKDRQVTKHQEDLMKQAEDKIYVSDFDKNLFIAYEGTPFVPISEDWTSKQIIEELGRLRQNYINAKIKQLC